MLREGRREGREERGGLWVTVPDQLAVDKELEFGVEFWETDRQRGPVMSRKDREEIMDRRTVSKEEKEERTVKKKKKSRTVFERMKQ